MSQPAIEYRAVDQLTPYARNARTHSEDQVAQIAASIREFGFTNPILVDGKNGIIAGHGRVLAAVHLGLTEVPVLILDHLSDDQKRAYVLADNKLAENAGWDMETLGVELTSLIGVGFDIGLLGFNENEQNAFLLEPGSLARTNSSGDGQGEGWDDMPEFDHADQSSFKRLVVNFENEADLNNFATLLGQKILPTTRSVWYPEAEIGRYSNKRFADEP